MSIEGYYCVFLISLHFWGPTPINCGLLSNSCTLSVGDVSLDLKKLHKENGYEISSGNQKFLLNICGNVPECGADVAVCEVTNNSNIILGYLSKYFISPMKPSMKYRGDAKKQSIIEFRCNRHITEHNITYVHGNELGKKRHFIFETPFFCVKNQMNCLVNTASSFQYDFRSLFLKNNNWAVKNITNGDMIYLNICGELNVINAQSTECSGGQICLINSQRTGINLGMYSSQFIVQDDLVSIMFNDGSNCGSNNYFSTKIDFICSTREEGPVLKSSSNCQYYLKWSTPAACPYYNVIDNNCTIQHPIYERRHVVLYENEDQKRNVNSGVLRFHFCGTLNQTCHGFRNVSYCLVKDGKEMIFGWTNSTIITKDGLPRMELYGDTCLKNKRRSVVVSLHCTYGNKPEEITISRNNCLATIKIYTNIVCPISETIQDCIIKYNKTSYYDLNPLISLNRNYEIVDETNRNIIFLLNICKPVIFGQNALCERTAAVCRFNRSEPNTYRRFKSLGYFDKIELFINQSSPWIQYTGSMCPTNDQKEFIVEIQLKCDQNSKNLSPKLLSHSLCKYNFVWETQYVCKVHTFTNNSKQFTTTSRTHILQKSKILQTNNVTALINKVFSNLNPFVQPESNKNIIQKPAFTPEKFKHRREETRQPFISFTVPINANNNTGLSINNCTVTDKSHSRGFNLYSLPRIVNVTSTTGIHYLINICSTTNSNNNFNITKIQSQNALEMDFNWNIKCKETGFFSSILLLKCSSENNKLEIAKEEKCRINFEWKLKQVCDFFDSGQNQEMKGSQIAVPIISSIIVTLLILIASIVIYYRRRHNYEVPNNSALRVRYNKMKESTKII